MTAGKTISYTLHGTVQLCDHRLHSFIMRAYNWPISCRKKSATCLLNSKLFNIHKDISTSHQLLSGFLDFETHTWFLCRYSKGPFNNYVDKKRGREGQQKVHLCSPRALQGRGCPLNVHVDQNLKTNLTISESISYHCALEINYIH